jgi:hypothetical protein
MVTYHEFVQHRLSCVIWLRKLAAEQAPRVAPVLAATGGET